jgi:hypothetical protein
LKASLAVYRVDGAVALVSSWEIIDDYSTLDVLEFEVSQEPTFPTRWNPENGWLAASRCLSLAINHNGIIQAHHQFSSGTFVKNLKLYRTIGLTCRPIGEMWAHGFHPCQRSRVDAQRRYAR